jgi:hypothetical protein
MSSKAEWASELRETAAKLIELADTLEPSASAAVRLVCDRCGSQSLDPVDAGTRCKATVAKQIDPSCVNVAWCVGTYRPDPIQAAAAQAVAESLAERVRLSDGRTLGITIDELAAHAACEAFAEEEGEDWHSFDPHMASTYRGAR